MNRARTLMLLLLVSPALSPALASPAPDIVAAQRDAAAPVAVSGAFSLVFNVNFALPVPAGATLLCRGRVAPGPFSLENWSAVPVQTAIGQGGITGPRATCRVEIPFSWKVLNARSGVALSYQIDVVYAAGALPMATLAQQDVGAPYPAPGATASVVFNVLF